MSFSVSALPYIIPNLPSFLSFPALATFPHIIHPHLSTNSLSILFENLPQHPLLSIFRHTFRPHLLPPQPNLSPRTPFLFIFTPSYAFILTVHKLFSFLHRLEPFSNSNIKFNSVLVEYSSAQEILGYPHSRLWVSHFCCETRYYHYFKNNESARRQPSLQHHKNSVQPTHCGMCC